MGILFNTISICQFRVVGDQPKKDLHAIFLEIRLGKKWANEAKNIQKWLASD